MLPMTSQPRYACDAAARRSFAVNGMTLRALEWGRPGRPALCFLHGGSAHSHWFDAVVPSFVDRFHIISLDQRGHGQSDWAPDARYGTEQFASDLVGVMDHLDWERMVVVGHSMGGIVISKAAELVPQRIAHLVYLAAVALRDGESLAQVQGPIVRALLAGMAAGRGDGTFLFPAELAWARWMGDIPRDQPALGAALASLTPQALRAFVEPAPLPRFWSLETPRTYVRCLRDAAVTPDRAAMFASRLGVTPIDLDTAHDPMLSAPDELARVLDRIPA